MSVYLQWFLTFVSCVTSLGIDYNYSPYLKKNTTGTYFTYNFHVPRDYLDLKNPG